MDFKSLYFASFVLKNTSKLIKIESKKNSIPLF